MAIIRDLKELARMCDCDWRLVYAALVLAVAIDAYLSPSERAKVIKALRAAGPDESALAVVLATSRIGRHRTGDPRLRPSRVHN